VCIEFIMRNCCGSSSIYRRITLGFLMFLSLWLLTAVLMPAQTAPAPQQGPGTNLQPIYSAAETLRQAVFGVQLNRWKAPGEVKDVAQDDLASIVNDLNQVLPGLLQAAQAQPTAFKPSFEVYRNLNALYDVVLRVSQAASLTGAPDAKNLQNALNQLAKARKDFSESLTIASDQRDAEVVQLRAKLQAAIINAAPKKVVVNDGPGSSAKKSKTPKPPSSSTQQ
jgi:hypothetical protein